MEIIGLGLHAVCAVLQTTIPRYGGMGFDHKMLPCQNGGMVGLVETQSQRPSHNISRQAAHVRPRV